MHEVQSKLFFETVNHSKTRISKAKIATHVTNREIRDFVAFLNRQNLKHFHLLWQGRKFLALDKAEALRSEAMDDLLPLIDMETWEEKSLPSRIEKFLCKMEEVGLSCSWDLLGSVDKKWLSRNCDLHCDFDQEFRNERVVKLGGFRWRIGMTVGHDGSARRRLYHFILRLIENGTLSRFRMCKNCGKIFAKDARSKCCSPKCKGAYDKLNRVEREQRREDRRRVSEARVRDREAFNDFREFMELAKKNYHTDKELAKMKPMLKALGGWKVVKELEKTLKEVASPEKIYATLATKQILGE